MADLVFSQTPALNGHLVFGEEGGVGQDVPITVAATLPELTLDALFAPIYHVEFSGTLPGLTLTANAVYDVAVPMRMLSVASHPYQEGVPTAQCLKAPHTDTVATHPATRNAHQDAGHLHRAFKNALQSLNRAHEARCPTHQDAVPLSGLINALHTDMLRFGRCGTRQRHQDAVRVSARLDALHTDMLRLGRQGYVQRHQDAIPVRKPWGGLYNVAMPFWRCWRGPFEVAMRPPPGTWTVVVPPPPPPTPCYVPDPHLLFIETRATDGHLLFVCERIPGPPDPPEPPGPIPIQEVYIVINDVFVTLPDGRPLPAQELSLSIDVDSWAFSWSGRFPAEALPDLAPLGPAEPVTVRAHINGVTFFLLVEKLGRERRFAQASLRASGRGRSAYLSAPYAREQMHSPTEGRTSQQLMDDVLTENGVSLGWTVLYNPLPWFVPAGCLSERGDYMTVLTRIAGACGAYIQPHPMDKTLYVLPRYPLVPWEWASLPDVLPLPPDIVTVEGIEWTDKPGYNRVFVAGQGQGGIVGQITRAGTAGDVIAPMVTDSLITDAIAARQRGLAILSDTGRQAQVSLSLPVLPETGLLFPGRAVRYFDGQTHRTGIVRSWSVSAGLPDLWQSIDIETHTA